MENLKFRYYIWGTGREAKKIRREFQGALCKLDIIGHIDNDKTKVGTKFMGLPVFSPEVLNDDRDAYLIILNRFFDEILCQIKHDYPHYVNRIDNRAIQRVQLIERYINSDDIEIKEIIEYLKTHILQVFNYSFLEHYNADEIDVEWDEEKELFFTIFEKKKMFFSKKFKTEDDVKRYIYSILIEQDEKSPHKYVDNSVSLRDAVVVDAGVAEGNFSLSHIEEIKHLYMFEPDNDWVEALKYTFEPWIDKVTIIPKCLSNYEDEYTTTIDSCVTEKIDYIKMDIEGEELYALNGSIKHIKSNKDIVCSICSYHQEFAYTALRDFFEKLGMVTKNSRGYMWFTDLNNEFRPPVLRRGLIYAKWEK